MKCPARTFGGEHIVEMIPRTITGDRTIYHCSCGTDFTWEDDFTWEIIPNYLSPTWENPLPQPTEHNPSLTSSRGVV